MNPWHDVKLYPEFPLVVPAIIEIPKDSEVKYEIDQATGLLVKERVLPDGIKWPANYGFIPQTYCADGDPMDIFILNKRALQSLWLTRARPIGVMAVIDRGNIDNKIISVDLGDSVFARFQHVEELPPEIIKTLYRFFDDYKTSLKKEITCNGFFGPEKAFELIKQSAHNYQINKTILAGYKK